MRHLLARHEADQSGLLRDRLPEGRVQDDEDQHGASLDRLPARIRRIHRKQLNMERARALGSGLESGL